LWNCIPLTFKSLYRVTSSRTKKINLFYFFPSTKNIKEKSEHQLIKNLSPKSCHRSQNQGYTSILHLSVSHLRTMWHSVLLRIALPFYFAWTVRYASANLNCMPYQSYWYLYMYSTPVSLGYSGVLYIQWFKSVLKKQVFKKAFKGSCVICCLRFLRTDGDFCHQGRDTEITQKQKN
jgi:hypothetical protein